MTSSTYGTVESQGDASPSPPKSYRLSNVAKIALALIAWRFRQLARECVEGYGTERRGG